MTLNFELLNLDALNKLNRSISTKWSLRVFHPIVTNKSRKSVSCGVEASQAKNPPQIYLIYILIYFDSLEVVGNNTKPSPNGNLMLIYHGGK